MTKGGDGERKGREVASGVQLRRERVPKPLPGEKERAPAPTPFSSSPRPVQKAAIQPPKPTPGWRSAPRPGRRVGSRAREACPSCIQLPVRLGKKPGAGLHPGEARAMAESFSVLGCGSTCPPLPPLPHVVQVKDTWRRRPIGSFKPRRGSGGGGGRLGSGGGGGRQWLDEWRGAGERKRGGVGEVGGRRRGGCHPEGRPGRTEKA